MQQECAQFNAFRHAYGMQPKNTHKHFLCPSFTGIGHIHSLGSKVLLLQEWKVQFTHAL